MRETKRMPDDFQTLPNGLKVLATEPDGEAGKALNANFSRIDLVIGGYVHQQSPASSVWTITHNLNKPVAVTVVDSADDVVYGDVRIVDLNTVTITFSASFSGRAYVV